MHTPSRREFVKTSLAAGVAAFSSWAVQQVAAASHVIPPVQLGFSLYGMKGLPLDEAIRTCAEIGYHHVELALLPGYPTDPAKFGKDDRKRLRDLLPATKLDVPCFMENLAAVTTPAGHLQNLDRIARAAELWNDVLPDSRRSILETVLGGKPTDWPQARAPMAAALRDWAETARKHDLIVAIKPHVGGAVYLPESAVQLLDDVDSPHLQAVYDFSHYQVQGLTLKKTLKTLAERTVFVHVKDGRRVDGKVQFLLPGEGGVDYVPLFNLLAEQHYQGSVTVEVSGQLSNRPDYDPHVAAKKSFDNLMRAVTAHADRAPRAKPLN